MKMKKDVHTDDKSDDKNIDPKLLENIVCKSTKKELKDTIVNLKNKDSLLEKYSVLLTTDKGYIKECLTQDQILETLDVSSKTKKMDLNLKYGPYYTDFTKDGRYLLVGGQRGQLAMMDWKTKDLKFDFNVKERIRAMKFLHKETMMAVSQKDYTFMYDNEGKEMHCIRQINEASHFEYLPYHFLLVAGTTKGFLNYLDISIGTMVTTIPTFHGNITMMCQNKSNAIICTGHSTGTVNMWSPNEKSPVMKMLCHDNSLRNITIDYSGNYLVTSGQDRKLKVWDLRMTYNELADLRLGGLVSHLEFSETGLLGFSTGNSIHVLQDVHMGCQSMSVDSSMSLADCLGKSSVTSAPIRNVRPLLSNSYNGTVNHISFCPYEDILAVGHANGISTMFVPGSGEPNFDAFEANPYADKNFRNEQEVKRLLEKIPSELIHLDSMVSSVHEPGIAEEFEADKKRLFGEKPTLEIKKKRSTKAKPKPATQKKVNTKGNLYYERLMLQKKLYEPDHSNYKKKREWSRAPIGSVLDNLNYKK